MEYTRFTNVEADNFKGEFTGAFMVPAVADSIAELSATPSDAEIATAVNAIIAVLESLGFIAEPAAE